MMKSAIVGLVEFCTGRPLWIVVLAVALGGGSAFYAARHFAIKTNVNDLISRDQPWTQRGIQFLNDFPQRDIIIVVDAPTPELVEQASAKLAAALRQRPDRFPAVNEPGSGSFFERNGLLFLPENEVVRVTDGLSRADDLLGTLAADPSLRGSLDALSLALIGVDRGEIKLDDLVLPMSMAANTVEAVLAGRPASFSWRALASGKPSEPQDLRRFIEVQPVLDFSDLRPGRAATQAISQVASDLKLDDGFQARVRQTGRVPMDDDEFGTITQNIGLTMTISLLLVVAVLWLALRSFRIIAAVMVSLVFGLAVSAAAGLFLVGTFNLISIAFFVLFVGLGVDFAIQFSVRYRAERHEHPDLRTALRSAAIKAGGPLALAAVAPENTGTLRHFVNAVLAVDPDATGPAIMLFEAGRTVVHAFIVSGLFALSAITVLLLIALRRAGDVLLTLVPLLIAGVLTLELCVVFDLPLNFANIIALPLLLGVGVAFKIYYIMAWRAGKTGLLQSSLTRAVVFSAMTTATAFGSLWLSSNPGTSSMGKLMALALICTMAAAVFFQPVLMGPPRKTAKRSPADEGGIAPVTKPRLFLDAK